MIAITIVDGVTEPPLFNFVRIVLNVNPIIQQLELLLGHDRLPRVKLLLPLLHTLDRAHLVFSVVFVLLLLHCIRLVTVLNHLVRIVPYLLDVRHELTI